MQPHMGLSENMALQNPRSLYIYISENHIIIPQVKIRYGKFPHICCGSPAALPGGLKVSDATTLMVNVFDETVVDAVLKAAAFHGVFGRGYSWPCQAYGDVIYVIYIYMIYIYIIYIYI